MDIVRNPWKPNKIHDPYLFLSNSQYQRKNFNDDRFYNIQQSSFLCQNQYLNAENKDVQDQPKSHKNNSSYLSILGRTCKIGSRKKNKKPNISSGYSSKIQRPGYFLNDQIEQTLKETSNSFSSQKISQTPYRILNAPKLKDDFYTNLLDWGSDDTVGVVLDNAAYAWNSRDNQTQKIVEGFISCLKFGKGLTLGQETGRIRIIDLQKKRDIGQHRSHKGRVGTMDYLTDNLLVSGSKDNSVMIWDLRTRSVTKTFQGHKQEICGVKWSFDGNFIASGSNDNTVCLWDQRTDRLYHKINEHTAAIKALAWSPHQNSILATGGGSTDKTIRVWNVNEKKCLKIVDTGSQVCNMLYSPNSNQLVSTHGFSLNSINVWDAKNMEKLNTLRGHSFRVLYLARSPDGESIVSGSGDQTLRFWKVFPSTNSQSAGGQLQAKNISIR